MDLIVRNVTASYGVGRLDDFHHIVSLCMAKFYGTIC